MSIRKVSAETIQVIKLPDNIIKCKLSMLKVTTFSIKYRRIQGFGRET
jgi:hypothetical protein